MKLVDVHCHINHASFKDELVEVLKRAEDAGVKAILVSGVNPPANREVLELVKKYPHILKASLGIYPIDAIGLAEGETGLPSQKEPIDLDAEFRFIEENMDDVAAIGEIGMDFHWADKEKTYVLQADNFRKIIRFAIKVKKPIVIHSRKAEQACVDILKEEIKRQEISVINHCFSGKKKIIQQAVELGHYFSIPANVVKSSQFQEMVKIVPLRQLLTETDAPWLSPFSEGKSEPAFVLESIKMIAKIKNMTEDAVAEQIWENYRKIFKVL
jgi:TatD DNase family protein